MACSHGSVLAGDGGHYGDWSDFEMCPQNTAVCGIRTLGRYSIVQYSTVQYCTVTPPSAASGPWVGVSINISIFNLIFGETSVKMAMLIPLFQWRIPRASSLTTLL